MITIIQIILTVGILVTGLYSYQRLRTTWLDALLIFTFVAVGLLFVFFPELSNKVAHFAGVSRGADLIFYVGVLFFFFLLIKLYARLRKLEQHITNIVREESLKNALFNNDMIAKELPKNESEA